MIKRCENVNESGYPDYGGRGIKVCPSWRESYEAFLEDVGLKPSRLHSIDRHPNNNGNYEPGNVRWALIDEQNQNRRSTKLSRGSVAEIRAACVRGELQRDVAKRFGVDFSTISDVVTGRTWKHR